MRRTRAGFGPCQGSFCSVKVAAALISHGKDPALVQEDLKASLRRRSIGVLPIVGESTGAVAAGDLEAVPLRTVWKLRRCRLQRTVQRVRTCYMERTVSINTECVVIGGGTAGCMAAATAAETRDIILLTKGAGTSYWSSGCIDVVGRVGGHYVEVSFRRDPDAR